MTVFCKPVDNAASTLEAARSLGESTITLASGSGGRFGTPSDSEPIRVTLVRATALDFAGRIIDPDRLAVFRCTERSGDTLSGLTLESGTDQDFSIGDTIAAFVTSQALEDIHDSVSDLETANRRNPGRN
jgi:hypothetical protein